MKRYILDGNVTDTTHVVGFASERLFVDYTDHAALLRAVAEEVGKMEHSKDCDCIPDPADFLDRPEDLCNCPKSRALALLEVE